MISESQRLRYNFEPKPETDTSIGLHIGRTLLSEYDYEEPEPDHKEPQSLTTNKLNLSLSNLNVSLELIKLNDTWHFTDPDICSKFLYFNETHAIK